MEKAQDESKQYNVIKRKNAQKKNETGTVKPTGTNEQIKKRKYTVTISKGPKWAKRWTWGRPKPSPSLARRGQGNETKKWKSKLGKEHKPKNP